MSSAQKERRFLCGMNILVSLGNCTKIPANALQCQKMREKASAVMGNSRIIAANYVLLIACCIDCGSEEDVTLQCFYRSDTGSNQSYIGVEYNGDGTEEDASTDASGDASNGESHNDY